MTTPIAPAEVELAANQVRRTIDNIRGRNRLLAIKVRDISDTLDSIWGVVKDLTERIPTKELVDTINSYNTKLTPIVGDLRNLIRTLESICDKLEEMIP